MAYAIPINKFALGDMTYCLDAWMLDAFVYVSMNSRRCDSLTFQSAIFLLAFLFSLVVAVAVVVIIVPSVLGVFFHTAQDSFHSNSRSSSLVRFISLPQIMLIRFVRFNVCYLGASELISVFHNSPSEDGIQEKKRDSNRTKKRKKFFFFINT